MTIEQLRFTRQCSLDLTRDSEVRRFARTVTDLLVALSPPLLAALQFAMGVVASAHVVLHKRDSRRRDRLDRPHLASALWRLDLYALIGINRLRRRATGLRTLRAYARIPERAL